MSFLDDTLEWESKLGLTIHNGNDGQCIAKTVNLQSQQQFININTTELQVHCTVDETWGYHDNQRSRKWPFTVGCFFSPNVVWRSFMQQPPTWSRTTFPSVKKQSSELLVSSLWGKKLSFHIKAGFDLSLQKKGTLIVEKDLLCHPHIAWNWWFMNPISQCAVSYLYVKGVICVHWVMVCKETRVI